tara:strand:+ start:423 stop:1139 length:717 start_codon:yes stop_codon:yes gene_type:complete
MKDITNAIRKYKPIGNFQIVEDILSDNKLKHVLEYMDNTEPISSKWSSGAMIKHTKNSWQHGTEDHTSKIWTESVLHKLVTNNFLTWHDINVLITTFISYKPGDGYGPHYDSVNMQNRTINIRQRADISYTIFLNEDYEGGDLIVCGQKVPKPKANSIILYDSGQVHEVTPVTKGTRKVIIGWIHTPIKDAKARIALSYCSYLLNKMTRKVYDDPSQENEDNMNALHYIYQWIERENR